MKKILTLITFFTITVSAYAQHKPGTLDSSFGTNGTVTFNYQEGLINCYGVALQSDGKIVCIGSGARIIGHMDWGISVSRFLKNGALDSSFGVAGTLFIDFGYESQEGRNIIIGPDDKIVVTGYGVSGMFDPDYDIITARLNANGSIDSSFGIHGKIIANFSKNDQASDLAIQPDGKILVFGTSSSHFILLRYMPDGRIDEDFGNNGKVQSPFISQGNAIALQLDEKIVAVGSYENKITLARYLPDGSADASFGANGMVVSAFGQEYNTANDVVVQPDGRIIIAGDVGNFLYDSLLLARYNADGNPDVSFGKAGFVVPRFEYSSTATKFAIQKDGKIVIGGYTGGNLGLVREFLVARFKVDGSLDSSFALNGQQRTKILDKDYAYGLALNSFNKIILAGTSTNGIRFISLAQYYNDDSIPQPTPIARIKRWLHKHGITWEDCPPSICNNISGYAVQRSPNGINWSTIFPSPLTAHRSLPTNSYADPSPLPGTNYYRLQTTSIDGAVAYSNVVAINNELSVMSISPNPARSVLRIDGLPSSAKIKITVVDLAGNVAMNYEPLAIRPSSINISQLKSGNYLLRIETEGEVVTKQFVKE